VLPEKRLILAQLRFFCQPDGEDEIAGLLSDVVDWGRYLDMCEAHGLEGAAYYVFKKLKLTGSLPVEVMDYLQWKYYQIAGRNIYLMDQLRRVVAAFEQAGLSLLPIKGASLVETIYPSVGTRPMNDVDLLVKRGQWPVAGKVLRRLGYSPLRWFPNLFSGNGVVLDVHFDLAGADRIRSRRYAVRIESDKLWAEAISSADSPAGRTLSEADTLLCLASHLQKHSFSRLIWFLDLALFLRQHQDVDWPGVWNRAQEFNLTKALYFVLCYLRSVLGLQLPRGMERALGAKPLNLAERRFLRALLAGEEMGLVGDILLAFSANSPAGGLHLLAETAFPRRQIMSQIYPLEGRYALLWAYPYRCLKVLVEAFRLFSWFFKPMRPGEVLRE